MPVRLYHCREYSAANIAHVLDADNNTVITDLSMPSTRARRKKLQGFFCKTAALIESPFVHNLVADSDTIFFKHPESIFESKQYLDTGAFFLNDRAITEKSIKWGQWLQFFDRNGASVNKTNIAEHVDKHGGTLFFHALQKRMEGEPFPWNTHTAESSAVYFNKETHPKTIAFLSKNVASFNLGFGDKEIYWMSTLCSAEAFTFSPFMASMYGGCKGAVLHWDPSQSLEQTLPFSMNAIDILEMASTVGHLIDTRVTLAVEFNTSIPSDFLRTIGDCNLYRESLGQCTCHLIDRHDDTYRLINPYLLLAQYVALQYRNLYIDTSYAVNGTVFAPPVLSSMEPSIILDLKSILKTYQVQHPLVAQLLD